MKNKTRSLIFALALVILTSCSKDDTDKNEAALSIGSITEQEFEASLPPTYDNFNIAYLKTLDNTPWKPGDKDFSRALFEVIKLNYASSGTANGADNEVFFSGSSFMNKQEWRLVLNDPEQAYTGISFIARSLDDASTYFPCDEDVSYFGAKATAFKQAFWSALMAKNTSVEFAKKLGDAREAITTNIAIKNMNLHNNSFGIELATRFPSASDNQLFELLIQENYFLISDNTDIDSDLDGLVFLNGIRDFDKTMTGSFGNPDSGGPWDITVNFSQCWNVVRGRFTIVRGEALQERRFSGVLEKGKMILRVSDPFVFENPEGLQACVEMIMVLEGDSTGLTGGWISSNCSLGGAVTLK